MIDVDQYLLPYHRNNYYNLSRNKDLNVAVENKCHAPWKFSVVDANGYCFICPCEIWMPLHSCHINDIESLDEIWHTSLANEIQQDIVNGKFTHCAVDRCLVADHDVDYDGYELGINIDDSCNLQCPSCRSDKIMHSSGELFDAKHAWVHKTIKLIENFDKPLRVIMSGNGDVLASHIMRPLIKNLQPKPNHKFRIFTNGLLLKKHLSNSPLLPNVDQIYISIDAGTKEVYEQVRRPGKWETLIENLDYLKTLSDSQRHIELRLVLHNENYTDLENFIKLALGYGFKANIGQFENWGTYIVDSIDRFGDHDVIGNIAHPNHLNAISILKELYTKYKDNNSVVFFPGVRNYVQ